MIKQGYTSSNDADVTRVTPIYHEGEAATDPRLSKTSMTPTSASTFSGYSDEGSFDHIQLEVGSIIKNTFELVAFLGEGGMGTVFKALNKVWEEVDARDPYVAIKVLKPELSANKQLVRSLYSDFDRTKMLANCFNIIKVYGFDRDGPHVYMTMEYLSGQTLDEYCNHEPIAFAQAWFIIEGIGKALAYAHNKNIVHRDIKPRNIIITKDNVVKVLDFGIASKINENEGDETKFGGHELGALTVAYASPEMQRDFPPDARDDIYAFACVIYEVLTGKQFYKQKIHKAAPIQGLNSRQMGILNKSLAFERDKRTSSIQELLDKLRPVKTPWGKYLGIAGAFCSIGLGLWGVLSFSPEVKQLTDSGPVQFPVVVKPPPLTSSPDLVVAPNQAPLPASTTVSVQEAAPEVATKPTPIYQEPGYSSTSKDGIIQIQTSKPTYKNGDPFQLIFTITQPMYVRVVDRDGKGVVSKLRPNAPQPDKLLPANKKHIYPPKNYESNVRGDSGYSTVTIVASAHPFPKAVQLLNTDGSVSEQIQSGSYSWTQIRYTVHK
ncbi:MAG: protein kinase [Methylococcaceae bacterium]|nr:protein kinase [Methylococcaceae bacterium]